MDYRGRQTDWSNRTNKKKQGIMDNTQYYRPIQYLGAKTRAISTIIDKCLQLYRPETYVIDMFSGSSVVSQSFYKHGMNVIANDVMAFCSDIASCVLDQGRNKYSENAISDFLKDFKNFNLQEKYTRTFEQGIAEEEHLLASLDLKGLKSLYDRFPQMGNARELTPQIDYISQHLNMSAIGDCPLIANYYAGSYFGIKQALHIDTLRTYIEMKFRENKDEWMYHLLLTALYNTCSIIVHSAGKHFAQPIQITDLDESKITNIRLFENRGYNVFNVFEECVNNLLSLQQKSNTDSQSLALNMDICSGDFLNSLRGKNVSVIYADPPYTAQQYSRFYHIPEVLHNYQYPQLQIFRGRVTQGLYPKGKYKSPFCSKTKVKQGFERMFEIVRDKQSHFMLSYSESKKKETGNERMITLEQILNLAHRIIPNYSVTQIDFDFDYRQLNTKNSIVDNKEDKEFLITFERQ